MPFDTTSAPVAQPHPTLFDKQIWLEAIMRRTDLTASAKVLAWRLADHHNQGTGRCNPSLPVLSKGTGTSRSVVATNLAALRDAGLITWATGNSSRSNSYILKGVEIHERAAKPASPASQRGKGPALRLVPKVDGPAPETVRPTGLRPSGPPDRQPSGQPDTNSPILTPEGTLPPSSPSSASDGPASPLRPSTGRRVEQDGTTTTPSGSVERQRKPRETPWPDTMGWTQEIRDAAWVHRAHSNDFIREAFFAFKAHAMKNSRRSTDWHQAWMTWYKEASRIESNRRKGAAV